jgi:hypothetical protein
VKWITKFLFFEHHLARRLHLAAIAANRPVVITIEE